MLRRVLAVAAVLSAVGCEAPPHQLGAIFSGPEVQAAIATCEQKYASRALTSWTQVAECERDLALPEQQRLQPWLGGMFAGVWRDKVDLYAKLDRGEVTKDEADRKIAIEADNWYDNIRSARRI
jgi:hypothetical protein